LDFVVQSINITNLLSRQPCRNRSFAQFLFMDFTLGVVNRRGLLFFCIEKSLGTSTILNGNGYAPKCKMMKPGSGWVVPSIVAAT